MRPTCGTQLKAKSQGRKFFGEMQSTRTKIFTKPSGKPSCHYYRTAGKISNGLTSLAKLFNLDRDMFKFLDHISYPVLIVLAVFLLLAPFRPMPHVIEKLLMLKAGALKRPIDVFDLFFHILPLILLAIKIVRDYAK
jgi:hypothetical protein